MMSFSSLSLTKVFKHFVKNPSMRSFEVLKFSIILAASKIHHPVCDLLRPSELYFIRDILSYRKYYAVDVSLMQRFVLKT